MTSKLTSRSKFAQLMTYHIFSHINRNKFITIMNCYCMTNKIRRNHASSSPCLNNILLTTLIH